MVWGSLVVKRFQMLGSKALLKTTVKVEWLMWICTGNKGYANIWFTDVIGRRKELKKAKEPLKRRGEGRKAAGLACEKRDKRDRIYFLFFLLHPQPPETPWKTDNLEISVSASLSSVTSQTACVLLLGFVLVSPQSPSYFKPHQYDTCTFLHYVQMLH